MTTEVLLISTVHSTARRHDSNIYYKEIVSYPLDEILPVSWKGNGI